MAETSKRGVWIGSAVLLIGLVLFLTLLKLRPVGPEGAPAWKPPTPPVGGVPPSGATGNDGPSHKTPVDPSATGTGADGAATGSGEGLEPGVNSGSTSGPVGPVTALDLATVALDAPPGGVSLVTPQFSPDGKRLMAISGKTAVKTVWVTEVDHPERGWIQVPGPEGLGEPSWVDNQTLAVIKDDHLFSYKLGGQLFAMVDEGDEPGRMAQPAVAANGTLVAYVSITTANGGGDIRVLDRSTSVVRNLTSTRAKAAEPAWRQDSKAVVGTLNHEVTAWTLDSSDQLYRYPRASAAKSPGWWGEDVHWQEGSSFAVNLVLARPPDGPRILVRNALASVDRPAPVAAGYLWISSLTERGTLWAVRKDGSGLVIDSDAMLASQPDAVEREDGVWIAFTSAEAGTGMTRIHVAQVDPALLKSE